MTQEPGKPGFFVSGRFAAVLAVLPVLEKLSGRGGVKKKVVAWQVQGVGFLYLLYFLYFENCPAGGGRKKKLCLGKCRDAALRPNISRR